MEGTNTQCGIQPSVFFLMLTLLVTTAATAMLCAAIMTDHWEYIKWDRDKLETIAKNIRNTTQRNHFTLEWLADGEIARILLTSKQKPKSSMFKIQHEELNQNLPALFLAPFHGGIWTMCISLSEIERAELHHYGFPQDVDCNNYLATDVMRGGEEYMRADWQHRMQNLSISCALVCLIILGSSALVGAFGVMKHQISAVLVTGVMYLLAATFAMFTLAIIHFKREQRQGDCYGAPSTFGLQVDGVVVSEKAQDRPYALGKSTDYFYARQYTTGWSLQLGWGGVGMCILCSFFWILLSKIMRYNPLTALLNGLTVL